MSWLAEKPKTVYVPPREDEAGIFTAEVLIHFERMILQPEPYQRLEPELVALGVVEQAIEGVPRPGALRMIERFALTSRLRSWIVSDRFASIGVGYCSALVDWLANHQLSDAVLLRLGYTNVYLPNAVTLDPQGLDLVPEYASEQDVWELLARQKGREVSYG